MSGLRTIAILFILFTVVSSGSVSGIRVADVEVATLSTVENVEKTVVEAYGAVFEAESVGADVSELLERLNTAGEYLALARMSLRTENIENAMGNASLSMEALDGLIEEAGFLRDKVIRESGERSWMAIGGSVVGVVAVICCSWMSWNWFKKRYHRRTLEMRPEVVEGES